MIAPAVGQETSPPPAPAPAPPSSFALPDPSPPPGPAKPERLNASVKVDVVKGSPAEFEAELAFLFKTEKGYITLRPEVAGLLAEEPAVTCPGGLKAEIKTVNVEPAPVEVGDGIGEGFVIRCRIVITAEAAAAAGEQVITVAFPEVSRVTGIIKAASPKEPPTCTYQVRVFQSFEDLEKAKAAELVAQEETRRAEQAAELSTDGDVINGQSIRLEGEAKFVFWTEKGQKSYRKFPLPRELIKDYKLLAPPGLKVTVESVGIEDRPVSEKSGNYTSTYDAYFIKVKLLVTAPKGALESNHEVSLSFPRVMEARQLLGAIEPNQTPAVRFTVCNFQNARSLGGARWWRSLLYALGSLVLAVLVGAGATKVLEGDGDETGGCGCFLVVTVLFLLGCAVQQFYMMFSYLRMAL